MPGKSLKTRIQNKVDSLANFQSNNPYLLSGELVTAYTTVGVKQEDGKYNIFYPNEWRGEFGDYYNEHLGKTISIFDPKKVWNIEAQGIVRSNVDFQIRNPSEIKSELEILKNELGENHE